MERHNPGQEEKLTEATMGMNGVAGNHQSRAQPGQRCSYFKCLITLVFLLALVIGLLASLVIYLVITTNLDAPPSPCTACVKLLPRSYSQGTYDIFTANKSADYFIYGWMRFPDVPGKNVTLFQTFKGQQRIISIQHANKTEIYFFDKIKLVKGGKICITLHFSYEDSLFHMHEV